MSRYTTSVCPPPSWIGPTYSSASMRLVTQDLPGQNPCWHALTSSNRYSLILLSTHRSMTLEINGSRDIGLYFSTCSLSPFLNTGTMFAIFYSYGSIPRRSDLLNILQRDEASSRGSALRSLAWISTGPVALLTSRVSSMDWTSATLSVRLVMTASSSSSQVVASIGLNRWQILM